ncbi:MAG: hypothetical protein PHD51_01005 [Patescibacteria group bacterium]|nr:hypothetical protein [Patescibacteria group bacterium]MDD5490559.1 hypothetical protein [Patescibacteria group bacterium]
MSDRGKKEFRELQSSIVELAKELSLGRKSGKKSQYSKKWLFRYADLKLEIVRSAERLTDREIMKLMNLCSLIDMAYTNIFEVDRMETFRKIIRKG